MKFNKSTKIGMMIGVILALPFFISLFILELGVFTNGDGICPYNEHETQTTPHGTPCERRADRGIPEGEITTGTTCVNGIYYQTDSRCITETLGFIESEGAIIFVWIFLAEFYGMVLGGIVGGLVGFSIKRRRERK